MTITLPDILQNPTFNKDGSIFFIELIPFLNISSNIIDDMMSICKQALEI